MTEIFANDLLRLSGVVFQCLFVGLLCVAMAKSVPGDDLLIDEDNDPVHDPEPLQDYMNKWDGPVFIEQMQLNSSKSVLEIGVGTGRLAVRVAPLCGEFYGVDISSKTIERAKENLAEFENVRLTCADFISYEFGRAFDVVYSSLTFMHIEDKQRAVNKIAGLLNDAGRFVLSIDKNPSEFIDTGTRKIKIFPDTPVEMAECIRTAGLTIRNQYETEFDMCTICGFKIF